MNNYFGLGYNIHCSSYGQLRQVFFNMLKFLGYIHKSHLVDSV